MVGKPPFCSSSSWNTEHAEKQPSRSEHSAPQIWQADQSHIKIGESLGMKDKGARQWNPQWDASPGLKDLGEIARE